MGVSKNSLEISGAFNKSQEFYWPDQKIMPFPVISPKVTFLDCAVAIPRMIMRGSTSEITWRISFFKGPVSELLVTRVTECPSNLSMYSRRKSGFHAAGRTGQRKKKSDKSSIPSKVYSVSWSNLKDCWKEIELE